MRKRNPVVLVFIAAAVLLAGLLILASARRATTDAPGSADGATVAVTTTRLAGATASTATPGRASSPSGATASPTTRSPGATSSDAITAPRGMASVRASALPAEARATLALVDAGGPFPFDQDGVVFQNREKILPSKPSGYYHEYTVVTPGSDDRGPRRIVVGDGGERYYTDDHYVSFRLVVP